jgi:dihydropteroate synthase-like protein
VTDRQPRHVLFVTGRLAAEPLRSLLARMEPGFEYVVAELPITVAAFLSVEWIIPRLVVDDDVDLILVPGWCQGNLMQLEASTGVRVELGPKDLLDIPRWFGDEREAVDLNDYSTKILAEIADAPLWPIDALLAQAEYYHQSGADIIDLGWLAQGGFPHIEEVLLELKARGFAVSLDTFHREDVLRANRVGFDYLLSINGSNLEIAREVDCQKVVVMPDFGQGLTSLERNAERLESWGVPYIMDPVVNPLMCGFTESIARYLETRRRFPDQEMLMGIGNLTELTDADSPGMNALLMGIVAELGIQYVLTTEVIPWAWGAVREVDAARRLMHFASQHQVLPKHLDDRLIVVKDPPFEVLTGSQLQEMQTKVRDHNYRIFCDGRQIFVFDGTRFITGTDPQAIFEQMALQDEAQHAFYVGRELEKASLAIRLGKRYVQDQPLRWGYLDEYQPGHHREAGG